MKRTTLFLATILSLGATAHGQQLIISDNYNVTPNGSGFVLDSGVNTGINPPVTRLTGSAAANLRYMNRAAKPDTSFLLAGNASNARFRVTAGAQSGRATISDDGVNPFDFGVALGVGSATPITPIEYDITISMDNNASGTHRMSFALGTVESSAGDWDFGLQLHKALAADDFYTVSKRVDTLSSGVADRNDPILTMGAGTAGSELDFLIRVTDAGVESTTFNSRVRVSLDGGDTWFYDTAADTTLLPNGFRFDGAGRFFSFDVAGGNSSFVAYDNFSVNALTIVPEPSTYALAGLGGMAMIWMRQRRKSADKR